MASNWAQALRGMPMYPDEPTWWDTFERAVQDRYVQAGRIAAGHPPPDWAAFRWSSRTAFDIGNGMDPDVAAAKHLQELDQALGLVDPPQPILVPRPSRDRVCGVQFHFQGLTVSTAQYGAIRWWDVAIDQLTPADRQLVYTAKRAAGDTHCAVALSHRYAEAGVPVPLSNGQDWTLGLPAFRNFLVEIINQGFTPIVALAGDGEGAGPGYNDPVGWTYGYDWLQAHLDGILAALVDCVPHCLFTPGFDGVFYGWEPSAEKIQAFGRHFRQLAPSGYLMLEHNTGHIPCGGGEADYAAGGPMAEYDVIASEWGEPLRQDSFWQVAGRLLGPAYVRPADQPAGDDPRPPFYLAPGTPRGPYYAVSYELVNPGLHAAVRNACTDAAIDSDRQYTRAAGYRYTG